VSRVHFVESKIQVQNVYPWLIHKSALSPASLTVALESMIWTINDF